MRKEPVQFRRDFLKDKRLSRAEQAAQAGDWGKPMPSQTAQESRFTASTRADRVLANRLHPGHARGRSPARDGPRVTKALVVVDAGFVINPRLQAQMIAALQDASRWRSTSSLHIAAASRSRAAGQLLLHARVNTRWTSRSSSCLHQQQPGRAANRVAPTMAASPARTPAPPHATDPVPDQPWHARLHAAAAQRPRRSRPRTASTGLLGILALRTHRHAHTHLHPPTRAGHVNAEDNVRSSGYSATSWCHRPKYAARSMSARPARATSTAVRSSVFGAVSDIKADR